MKLLLLTVALFFVVAQAQMPKHNYSVPYTATPEQEKLIDSIQYYSYKYFIEEINPENGLVRDRSTAESPASMAAVGFAIPSWAVGVEHGWLARDAAAAKTLRLLEFLMNSEQSTHPDATGYKGFYYHFITMDAGKRVWKCELSSVDTALLLAGIRFGVQYFNGDNETEKRIRVLGDSLTYRVDWEFMQLSPTSIHENNISMAWYPEKGLQEWGWRGYNEALILFVIAAGSGWEGYEAGYQSWLKGYEWIEPYPGLGHVGFGPLFGHQFSHKFIDFRGIYDGYMAEKGIDYFENSRRATFVQQKYAIENPMGWVGHDSLTWGFTASDGPGEKYNFGDKKFKTYHARGTMGTSVWYDDDGTIAPTAPGGSIAFAPEIVIPTLENMYSKYGKKGLWGKYGFLDAFNLTLNWYNPDFIGIDQGPFVVMIENMRTGLIWEYTMRDPVIQSGLKKLGFVKK